MSDVGQIQSWSPTIRIRLGEGVHKPSILLVGF
jgi:hypothetical protein